MFKPNNKCLVYKANQTNAYGETILANPRVERFSIVHLNVISQDSSVRADSSASRGAALETVSEAKFLFTKMTEVEIDDVVEIAGVKVEISSKMPRFNVRGKLDHYEVDGRIWRDK